MDEVEEYGYWNGTGSYPDGATRPDWEMREAAWERRHRPRLHAGDEGRV
jgi:hypothetical protein